MGLHRSRLGRLGINCWCRCRLFRTLGLNLCLRRRTLGLSLRLLSARSRPNWRLRWNSVLRSHRRLGLCGWLLLLHWRLLGLLRRRRLLRLLRLLWALRLGRKARRSWTHCWDTGRRRICSIHSSLVRAGTTEPLLLLLLCLLLWRISIIRRHLWGLLHLTRCPSIERTSRTPKNCRIIWHLRRGRFLHRRLLLNPEVLDIATTKHNILVDIF